MIEVTKSGAVNYVRVNEDGSTWRCAIACGDLDEAEKHLDKDELAQVQEAWTPEVVQKWVDEHPEPAPRAKTREQMRQEQEAAEKERLHGLFEEWLRERNGNRSLS